MERSITGDRLIDEHDRPAAVDLVEAAGRIGTAFTVVKFLYEFG